MLTPDVGEMLVLKRILQAMECSKEENWKERIFHSRCSIQGMVYRL